MTNQPALLPGAIADDTPGINTHLEAGQADISRSQGRKGFQSAAEVVAQIAQGASAKRQLEPIRPGCGGQAAQCRSEAFKGIQARLVGQGCNEGLGPSGQYAVARKPLNAGSRVEQYRMAKIAQQPESRKGIRLVRKLDQPIARGLRCAHAAVPGSSAAFSVRDAGWPKCFWA